MPDKDRITDRCRELRDSFCADQQPETIETMMRSPPTPEAKTALAVAAGISDPAALDHLLAADIRAETITALGIVPLLAVAWADGQADDKEKQAILSACDAEGILSGSHGYRLLESWLDAKPNDRLLTAWKHFIRVAHSVLSPQAMSALSDDVLNRARRIACASNPNVGTTSDSLSVSESEQRTLDELRRAFQLANHTAN